LTRQPEELAMSVRTDNVHTSHNAAGRLHIPPPRVVTAGCLLACCVALAGNAEQVGSAQSTLNSPPSPVQAIEAAVAADELAVCPVEDAPCQLPPWAYRPCRDLWEDFMIYLLTLPRLKV
jgi:hypothetical protein